MHGRAGDGRDLAFEPVDDLEDVRLPLAARLQHDLEAADVLRRVELADADDRGDAGDICVVRDDCRHLALQTGHFGKRDLRSAFDDRRNGAGVLIRKEALRHDDVEPDRDDDRDQENEQRRRLMAQNEFERAPVTADDRIHEAAEELADAAAALMSAGAQKPRAHHRRQCQRYDRRDDDGNRQRQRELAEHAADETRHEQERDENRNQRHRQRYHREADLARAIEGGLHRLLALFEMAHDVLDHDDRIVDDEAGADRQRHQRQVVDAEAAEIHDAERGDERNRQRDAGDDRGPERAQEEQHDHDDEADAQDERELHVVDGGADRSGAVADDLQIDACRHAALDARQLGFYAGNRVDDVGAGLSLNVDDDGGLAIVPAADSRVLESVLDRRDIFQANRCAVAIGDDDVFVGLRVGYLVVGGDGVGLLVAVE